MLNDKNSNYNYVPKSKSIPTIAILFSSIAFIGIAGIAITTSIDSDIAYSKSTALKKAHTTEANPLDDAVVEKNLNRDKALILQRKAAVDESVTTDVKNAATMVEKYIYTTKPNAKPLLTLDDNKEETSIGKIRTAKGNELFITGDTFHYVIKGNNVKGNKSVEGIYYDSLEGGLQENPVKEIVGKSVIVVMEDFVRQFD